MSSISSINSLPTLAELTGRVVLKPCLIQAPSFIDDRYREFEIVAYGKADSAFSVGDHVLVDTTKCNFYHAAKDEKLKPSAIPFSMRRAWVKLDAIVGKVEVVNRTFTNILGDKK